MGNSPKRYEMERICFRGVRKEDTSFGPEFSLDPNVRIKSWSPDQDIWRCSRPYSTSTELEKDAKIAEQNYPDSLVVIDSMNHILAGDSVREQLYRYDQDAPR